MSSAASVNEPLHDAPIHLPRIRFSWPAGTTGFAFRTWLALALGYYAAFWFELSGASSVGVCVLILAQPAQGMALSKAFYRFLGTLIGCLAALCITAAFPQDRTMLIASFAVFMALQTAIGSILRDFRSYASILAGYTVAIISISDINAPNSVFDSAVNRTAAIALGIASVAIVNFVLAGAESYDTLIKKMRGAVKDVLDLAGETIEQGEQPSAPVCVDLAARLMPLRTDLSYARTEQLDGARRTEGGKSALLGLFETLSAIQAVGAGLSAVRSPSMVVTGTIDVARRALRLQDPERLLPELRALTRPALAANSLSIEAAFLIDRVTALLHSLGDVRDGMRALRFGFEPRRRVKLEVHQDFVAVFFNAMRVLVAVGLVGFLGVWSGLADFSIVLLFTTVFISLGAVQPDPTVLGKAALFGMPLVVLTGVVYAFFIFPNISGYPLFIVSLAPLVVIMCWLIKLGLGGAGLIYGVQSIVIVSPANLQTLNAVDFTASAPMYALSGIFIFVAMVLVFPVDPAQRRLRLAIASVDNLRKAVADEKALAQPRASRHYDRLNQFKTWQKPDEITLARRTIMKRLSDLGNLAYAVRRSWRSLDEARPFVDPSLDRRARAALPALAADETAAVARLYLQAATGLTRPGAIRTMHAAASMYGTSLATRQEVRLLRRAGLSRTPR